MCAALHSISVLDGTICSTNDACTALECEIVNNRVQLGVEVCHHPPGIRVSVYDSTDHAVFDQAFYEGTRTVSSENIPFSLVVTVEHPSPMTITVEVNYTLCHMIRGKKVYMSCRPDYRYTWGNSAVYG